MNHSRVPIPTALAHGHGLDEPVGTARTTDTFCEQCHGFFVPLTPELRAELHTHSEAAQ